MLIVLHVLIAVTSILYGAISAIAPTKRRLHVSYGLVVATLASGTWLVVSLGSPILSSCVTGLLYLAVTCSGLIVAQRRLASQRQ